MNLIITVNVLGNEDGTWTIHLHGPPDPPELTFRANWKCDSQTFPDRFKQMADVAMQLLKIRNDKLPEYTRS